MFTNIQTLISLSCLHNKLLMIALEIEVHQHSAYKIICFIMEHCLNQNRNAFAIAFVISNTVGAAWWDHFGPGHI